MKKKLIGILLITPIIVLGLAYPEHLKYIMNDIMTGGPCLVTSLGSMSILVGIWLLGGDAIIDSENEIFAQKEQQEETEEPRSVRSPLLSRVMYGNAEFDDTLE